VMGSSAMANHPSHSQSVGNTFGSPHLAVGRVHHGNQDSEIRRHWMLKMEFPQFDGSSVKVWLDKCAAYFHLYSIPHDFRVTATSLHMVDRASSWFGTFYCGSIL
jgi:hypothetical protein